MFYACRVLFKRNWSWFKNWNEIMRNSACTIFVPHCVFLLTDLSQRVNLVVKCTGLKQRILRTVELFWKFNLILTGIAVSIALPLMQDLGCYLTQGHTIVVLRKNLHFVIFWAIGPDFHVHSNQPASCWSSSSDSGAWWCLPFYLRQPLRGCRGRWSANHTLGRKVLRRRLYQLISLASLSAF